MQVDAVIQRIDANVAVLAGRVEGALALAELVKQNALPQVTPAAYVLPLGVRGLAADAVTGLFRQGFEEIVGVLLFVESAGDATGGEAIPDLDAISLAIIEAVAGWAPADAIGVFRLSRAELVSLADGMAIYQIDFSVENQLRLPTSA